MSNNSFFVVTRYFWYSYRYVHFVIITPRDINNSISRRSARYPLLISSSVAKNWQHLNEVHFSPKNNQSFQNRPSTPNTIYNKLSLSGSPSLDLMLPPPFWNKVYNQVHLDTNGRQAPEKLQSQEPSISNFSSTPSTLTLAYGLTIVEWRVIIDSNTLPPSVKKKISLFNSVRVVRRVWMKYIFII